MKKQKFQNPPKWINAGSKFLLVAGIFILTLGRAEILIYKTPLLSNLKTELPSSDPVSGEKPVQTSNTHLSFAILPDTTPPEPPIISKITPTNNAEFYTITLKSEYAATLLINGEPAGEIENKDGFFDVVFYLSVGQNLFNLETQDWSGNFSTIQEIILERRPQAGDAKKFEVVQYLPTKPKNFITPIETYPLPTPPTQINEPTSSAASSPGMPGTPTAATPNTHIKADDTINTDEKSKNITGGGTFYSKNFALNKSIILIMKFKITEDLMLPKELLIKSPLSLSRKTVLPKALVLGGDLKLPTNLKLKKEIQISSKVTLSSKKGLSSETILKKGTTLPAGMVLSKGTKINSGNTLPAGTIIPTGSRLPKGMIIPVDTILPRGFKLDRGLKISLKFLKILTDQMVEKAFQVNSFI